MTAFLPIAGELLLPSRPDLATLVSLAAFAPLLLGAVGGSLVLCWLLFAADLAAMFVAGRRTLRWLRAAGVSEFVIGFPALAAAVAAYFVLNLGVVLAILSLAAGLAAHA